MASEGANNPGTMADDAAVGDVAWINPDNAKTSNDVYAFCLTDIPGTSHYLKATNFGFSISGTINGIVVTIERKRVGTAGIINDEEVKIVKSDGSIGTENNAKADIWTTTEETKSYGSADDLWSESWTDADINDADFGVVLQTDHGILGMGQRDPGVDHITITVYYTPAVPPANPLIGKPLINPDIVKKAIIR